MTTNATIGSLQVNLGLNSAAFQEALDKVQRDARAGAQKTAAAFKQGFAGFGDGVKGEIEGLAGQFPVLSNAVTGAAGAFGLAAIGGVAAFTAALAKARVAMDWAAELTDQAAMIGVSTEALQEYRFVADEAGVAISDMEGGLKALNSALGAMQTGVANKKIAKVFEALGITQADLEPMRDASDLLPLVADRISKLGTQAQQAQIAEKLGIGGLLPLLQQGADGLNRMRQQARDLGLVLSNETVGGLDAAQRKAEIASQVIDTQLNQAFADLAPVITGVTQALADGIRMMMSYVNRFRQVKSLGGSELERERQRLYEKLTDPNADMNYKAEDFAARANWLRNGRGLLGIPLPQYGGVRASDEKRMTEILKKISAEKFAVPEVPTIPDGFGNGSGGDGAARKKVAKDIQTALEKSGDRIDLYNDRIQGVFTPEQIALAKVLNGEIKLQTEMLATDLIPQVEVAKSQFEELALTVGTELADAFGDAIAYGDDLGESFERVVRRMIASWASSGLMDLFGINSNGGATGGGLLGMLKGGNGLTDVNKDGTRGVSFGSILSGLPTLGGLGGVLSKLPGFAAGTLRAPGGLSWVGEEGPELMNVPRGAQVFPAHVSRALMSGGSPVEVRVSVDKSKYFDVAVEQVAAPLAKDAAVQGATGGANIAAARSARSQSRKLR